MLLPITRILCALAISLQAFSAHAQDQSDSVTALPGTQPLLDLPEDPAAAMVAGIDRFALRELAEADAQRGNYWQDATSKAENVQFLKDRLGLPKNRQSFKAGTLLRDVKPVYSDARMTIHAVRWPVLAHPAPQLKNTVSLWGEGLWIEPAEPIGTLAIVLPDADESPELYLGLSDDAKQGIGFQQRLVRDLVENRVTVLIAHLVSRTIMKHGNASLTKREYLHRPAFELGETLLGYEVQTIQAALDQFDLEKQMVFGFGEGGRVGLYASVVDERIDTMVCCGYFGPRDSCWSEPLSRNLFGVYTRFADAELGAMLARRRLVISEHPSYSVELSGNGGAPAKWSSPTRSEVVQEFQRMLEFANTRLHAEKSYATLLSSSPSVGELEEQLMKELDMESRSGGKRRLLAATTAEDRATQREARLVATIDAHAQAVLEESEYIRTQFMNIGLERSNASDGHNVVDTSSEKAYAKSIERFREKFSEEVIGKFQNQLLPADARTRRGYEGNGWTGYDVVLDVFPDVFAYGVLLLPNDIGPNEGRPLVVCQHGLEGRPQDVIAGDHYAYHDFAAKLAERGFIVFAPQNPYIGKDDFRTLQRKMNPIGKTLFSVITPQHEQILRWLSSLPQVDPKRIAFYGLSYGGKSAMRLPALLPQYCLSICSADFNDWVWKNASSRSPYSYVGTGEYEIFEFNLGKTFNYAEMAALIAPRPFMVERGHFDGVAPDDRVAKEFAKVRFLYAARLSLPDRCEIEWFQGPHTIHGNGTFKFLHQHLNWPEP